ncbi:MAG: ABC transporter substrate-binding protein [Planctomycetota bacterium]|jgi:branched-chain amino acid transport system substrate-binding protein
MSARAPLGLGRIALLVVVLAGVATFGGAPTACAPDSKGAIGIVLPLTGVLKEWGLELQAGIQLALDEDPDAARRVLWSDNGGTATGTTAAIEHLVEGGATVIIGPLTTDNAVTAGIVSRSLRVPLVVPAATGPGITPPGGSSVRICYEDGQAGRALARWAAADAGLSRLAVVVDLESAYSIGLAQAFEREFRRLGRRVVGEVPYRSGSAARAGVLDRVAALDVEGALVAGYAPDIVVMVQGARSEAVGGLTLLGGDGWSGAGLRQALSGRVAGAYHTRHLDPTANEPLVGSFLSTYEARHEAPPSDAAALGYDAARVVLSVHDPLASGLELVARLRAVRGFAGVTGTIALDPLGSAMGKQVVLVRIDDASGPMVIGRLDG